MWKFHTIYKSKLWGGNMIASLKGISAPAELIGESWEVSAIPGSVSVVKSAADHDLSLVELVEKYGARLTGERVRQVNGDRFPLLVKFIDAASDLSVQVHPDDKMAAEEGLPNGKTEMFYIIHTLPGARIANGFRRPVSASDYHHLIESGEIEGCMRFTDTSAGMAFFIPAGRIHAIGAGNLICEIQDSSDTTYRLYDYRRVDADGHQRELHTEHAFRALNFNDCSEGLIESTSLPGGHERLLRYDKFTVNLLKCTGATERDYSRLDSFVLAVCVKGSCRLTSRNRDSETPGMHELSLREGEAVLIPAAAGGVEIATTEGAEILETYVTPVCETDDAC